MANPELLQPKDQAEPRWPAKLALLAIVGLYLGLPDFLTFGHTWLIASILLLAIVALVATNRSGRNDLNHTLGIAVNGFTTTLMIASIGLLIKSLPEHKEPPAALLRSAAALWITNILVFAAWYWRLDAGGPHQRAMRSHHHEGAFLFPQMGMRHGTWSPQFVDYLFLAFNTSTALSPADTQALSRWAKLLMMAQSLISLTIIVLLVARSVNIM
jgi:uncharacterized membrane protein